ncbi:MAG: hypothetical protein ACLPN5_00535 [Roseiarcus sp.]
MLKHIIHGSVLALTAVLWAGAANAAIDAEDGYTGSLEALNVAKAASKEFTETFDLLAGSTYTFNLGRLTAYLKGTLTPAAVSWTYTVDDNKTGLTLVGPTTGTGSSFALPTGTETKKGVAVDKVYIDFTNSSNKAATVSFTPSVSVPGPIAGAGLPALLGMLGFGAWARRKRAA